MKLTSLFTRILGRDTGNCTMTYAQAERWAEVEYGKEKDYALNYIMQHGIGPKLHNANNGDTPEQVQQNSNLKGWV